MPAEPAVFVLPAGLTVAAAQVAGPGFSFDLRVPLGSAHDPQGQEGSASVLEEWLGKGAGGRSSREWVDALDDLGVRRGGGVGAESTRFAAAGLSGDLEAALTLYADLLRRPHLPGSDLPVLLDLARQDLEAMEDSPAERLALAARRAAFPFPAGGQRSAGYAHPASGTPSGLEGITAASLRAQYRRLGARGSILSVVSPLAPGAVWALAEQLFGDWEPGDLRPVPLHYAGPGQLHLPDDSNQTHLSLYWPGVSPRSRDWLPWHLALGALSGGSASRLFTAVREERGLAYSAQISALLLAGEGLTSGYAGSTPDKAQETLDVMLAELERLRAGITAAEFSRAHSALLISTVFGAESIRARAAGMARDLQVFGRVRTPESLRAELHAVTLDDVNRFLAGWQPGAPNLTTLGRAALHPTLAVAG